jgi:hypothetical protein
MQTILPPYDNVKTINFSNVKNQCSWERIKLKFNGPGTNRTRSREFRHPAFLLGKVRAREKRERTRRGELSVLFRR